MTVLFFLARHADEGPGDLHSVCSKYRRGCYSETGSGCCFIKNSTAEDTFHPLQCCFFTFSRLPYRYRITCSGQMIIRSTGIFLPVSVFRILCLVDHILHIVQSNIITS